MSPSGNSFLPFVHTERIFTNFNFNFFLRFELEDAELRPDQEPFMVEAIHAAAFANNTLGLPKMCPESNVDAAINRAVLMNFLKSYHTPDRMVLAGVGVDHDQLVEIAQVIIFHSFNVNGNSSTYIINNLLLLKIRILILNLYLNY